VKKLVTEIVSGDLLIGSDVARRIYPNPSEAKAWVASYPILVVGRVEEYSSDFFVLDSAGVCGHLYFVYDRTVEVEQGEG
jgi:hypothetical protein